jgi:hypothetical protein
MMQVVVVAEERSFINNLLIVTIEWDAKDPATISLCVDLFSTSKAANALSNAERDSTDFTRI